jgi:hypothetical protein
MQDDADRPAARLSLTAVHLHQMNMVAGRQAGMALVVICEGGTISAEENEVL